MSSAQHPEPEALLRARGLTKRFPGVTALDDVSFDLRAGEVHVLLGENGAGKSTLIKVLSGVYTPEEGTVEIRGRPVADLSPAKAAKFGVSTVFQELSLVPQLTIAENIYLGQEPRTPAGLLDKAAMAEGAQRALATIGERMDVATPVGQLGRAVQQVVEIAKALHRESPVLILDEPTASLSDRETARLFNVIQALRERGVGIVYITHRLPEIHRLGDRVTVLRDGKHIATLDRGGINDDNMIRLMTGREVGSLYPENKADPGPVRLKVDGLSGPDFNEVSLHVRGGEIVGMAGLVGSGKDTIARSLFGLEPTTAGTVAVDDQPLTHRSPAAAMTAGLNYYPSDRRTEGLVQGASLADNIVLSALTTEGLSRAGIVRRRAAAKLARRVIDDLNIRPAAPSRPIRDFSGGNQQKAVIGRAFTRPFAVHVFDEPTVGVDVGAKAELYRLMTQLCADGAAVLVVSSDLEELMGLVDRLYVVRSGHIVAELAGESMSEQNVLGSFFDHEVTLSTNGTYEHG